MSDLNYDRQIDRSKMQIGSEVAIEISEMNKWYGTFHVLRDINLDGEFGRADRDLWSVRVGEIDPHPLYQPS